jgi:hypothetical protein
MTNGDENWIEYTIMLSPSDGRGTLGQGQRIIEAMDASMKYRPTENPSFWALRSESSAETRLVSACHRLWYLHICAVSGITVVDYVDHAEGFMEESEDGSGHFQKVILKPQVTVTVGADVSKARELHKAAREKCGIANSVNFRVEHEPEIMISQGSASVKDHSAK